MSAKICPIIVAGLYADPDVGKDIEGNDMGFCRMSRCELWTTAYNDPIEQGSYTTEGCAFRINAMKNSEGKIPV